MRLISWCYVTNQPEGFIVETRNQALQTDNDDNDENNKYEEFSKINPKKKLMKKKVNDKRKPIRN